MAALQVDVAQFKLEDFTDAQFKKLDKNLQKTIKDFVKAEKQAKETDGALTRLGKGFNRFGGRALQKGGAGLQKGVQGIGGGIGGLSNAATAIPFLGAAVAAGLVAINSVRQNFIQGISLKKDLLSFSSNFQASFRKQSQGVLKTFTRDGFFRKEDVEANLTALTDAGISPEAIKKNAGVLNQFARSQGFTDLGQALAALQGGQVKAGRGISQTDILQLQEVASLLSNVATANQGFELLTRILQRNSEGIEKFSKQTTQSLSDTVKSQNKILDVEQKLALSGAEAGDQVFEAVSKTEQAQRNILNSIAKTGDATIQKLEKAFGTDSSDTENFSRGSSGRRRRRGAGNNLEGTIQKRQGGGRVSPIGIYEVNEKGREFFTPDRSGKIISNNSASNSKPAPVAKTAQNRQVVNNINIVNHINASSGRIARELEKQITNTLNKLASTTLRQETGLPLQRGI